jgi:hypothetical protein
MYHVELGGRDIGGFDEFQVSSVQDCCALCRLRKDCGAWGVMKSSIVRCWLKAYADVPDTIIIGLVNR